MTVKEALERIGKTTLHEIDSVGNITTKSIRDSIEYKTIEQALTPPTSDEVCKALSEYSGRNVYYERGFFFCRKEEFYNQPIIIADKYKSGLIEITKNVLPPHLITLIGRFYEGLEK